MTAEHLASQVEQSGRSLEEAVERALGALGVPREEAEIEVLDAGSRGVLGIGARDARVRVTARRSPASVAQMLTARLLQVMGLSATVDVQQRADGIFIEIRGKNLAPLIGRRGTTREALELILGLMVSRQARAQTRVLVDVEGYLQRRRATLQALATRTAELAVREGREIALEPMVARDRRIVHMALADHPGVTTFSRGEGAARHVVIAPRSNSTPRGD